MNRLEKVFATKSERVLNVYFTAGFPEIHDTHTIAIGLDEAGVDIIEIGMPYSDPLADGKTIQDSSSTALENGMHLNILFDQIKQIRANSDIAIILMGYYNQLLQFGHDKFLEKAKESGVDGLIIPDMPMRVYETEHKAKYEELDLRISFLVTPQTDKSRIQKAISLSSAFLYVVSQSSITGSRQTLNQEQVEYFKLINDLKGETPSLIGFGIHNNDSFNEACKYANGAIVGSQFIRSLEKYGAKKEKISAFVRDIKG